MWLMQAHMDLMAQCDQQSLMSLWDDSRAAAEHCLALMGQSTAMIVQYLKGTCPEVFGAWVLELQAHNAAFPRHGMHGLIRRHHTALVTSLVLLGTMFGNSL